jgi:hypothetical protein
MTAPNANISVGDLQQKVMSLAMATGMFLSIAGHEPESPPQEGLTGGLWLQNIGPAKGLSGQAATSARVEFLLRIYIPTSGTTPEQLDSIDPSIGTATAVVIGALSGDFELEGEAFAVDLLGGWGAPLAGKAGWTRVGQQLVRVMDITVPLLLDGVWAQTAVAAGS